MKAIAIVPGHPETAGLIDLPEPPDRGRVRTGPNALHRNLWHRCGNRHRWYRRASARRGTTCPGT